MKNPASELKILAENIDKRVRQICCNSSSNVGAAETATIEIFRFYKAIYFTFYPERQSDTVNTTCNKKLALTTMLKTTGPGICDSSW